ncbi:low molecular weight phosphatase family protein [Roseibium aestuarii]|uniref:Low molecular weight phosphatase family protein n=1 Tax=Roseibium aestuarii TaxID=2600299 RepID=A0ABW4JYC4_9HYPH|nr:hypothetical protein [Roseibium aestuarii]
MSKTSVLFLCRDNALLSPLAEAYLNQRGDGLVRAFSAGVHGTRDLDSSVPRLLGARGLSFETLEPKSFEIFTFPHAPMPDRVILLDGSALPDLPRHWEGHVAVNAWNVAAGIGYPHSFAAAGEYFRRIRHAVDRVLEPEPVFPTARVA